MAARTHIYIEVRLKKWNYMPAVHRGDATGLSEGGIDLVIQDLEGLYGLDEHIICVVQCATELPVFA